MTDTNKQTNALAGSDAPTCSLMLILERELDRYQPHTIKLMETNTNTPEAKQPASAGCNPTPCSASSLPRWRFHKIRNTNGWIGIVDTHRENAGHISGWVRPEDSELALAALNHFQPNVRHSIPPLAEGEECESLSSRLGREGKIEAGVPPVTPTAGRGDASVDLTDTAAQDSASESNNPAVSG